jgi:5'-nucleotidase
MQILVTNDDGINSDGLWALVRELREIARITVVVPDSERSAIGTALSLFQPLQVKEVAPIVSGVTAYTVDGTPADCVVLALGKLVRDRVDIVVSGINLGPNVGEDVYISGTVGGALQGYFRGSCAMAVSAPRNSKSGLETAARATAVLAGHITAASPAVRVFLNVNVPDLPPDRIAGAKITRLARTSHINTVEEDDHDRQRHYHLIRQQVDEAAERGTDIHARDHGYISITPLFTSLYERPPQPLLKRLCADFYQELNSRR